MIVNTFSFQELVNLIFFFFQQIQLPYEVEAPLNLKNRKMTSLNHILPHHSF